MLSRKAKTRLPKLIKFMKTVNRRFRPHFDMGTWFEHYGSVDFSTEHNISPGQVLKLENLHTCGTTACALGYAAVCPALQSTGLRLVADQDGANIRMHESQYGENPVRMAERVFGLDHDQAQRLFTCAVNTPAEWARYAERFMHEETRA